MKESIVALTMSLVASLLLPLSVVLGQQKQTPVIQPKVGVSPLSVFVSGSYFGPKYTNVNAVYQVIEHNLSLPAGNDFKSYYFVLTGVRLTLGNGQAVQGEFGGSVMKSTKDSSTNFLQLYYAGGSYIISFPLPMVSIYGGGGLGYLWLNSQRTYGTRLGVATVNGQLVQLHGMLGIEFFDPSGVSFALEGRYTNAITVSPTRADLDFTLKGIDVGIRIGVPITF
jgi:hypothetical protein